ncbi:MAG: protein translocase subunit SecD [Deltaproteobacteria bacterium]|nr:protein translocase subunit SecD [Deltaproteobacteria bacterium]
MALLYLTPSISGDLPPWWSGLLPQEKIRLGLDLQGGMHLVLEVEAEKAVESHLERVVEELRHDLRRKKIRYLELKRSGVAGVDLTLMREEDRQDVETLVKSNYSDFSLEDAAGAEKGAALRLTLNPKARNNIMRMATDQALETIRNRVDQFGVSEPDIRPQENYRILIQLPGVKDPDRAMKLIGKTALLEFKLVDEENSLQEALNGNIPPGREILYEESIDPKTGRKARIPYLLKKRTLITGEYLTDARVQIDTQYNEPYVSLSFNARGARLFERITGDNIGKKLAIVLDNHVYTAPVIRDRISGGRAQITGIPTMEEAKDLAIVLRAGALPAPVKILEERTVGPSLGKDSIQKGFKSMIIGGIVVVLFMVFYYGLSGMIADFALLLNILFIMSGLAFFGATLTLPGIAGIILTIGMSVDANVLIFERIREELRLGKPPRAAIEGGYGKAFVTILDANVTTFIAALVLFQFGTGPIRGFAVTLSIGITASFITAVFMTRIIFDYLFINQKWKRMSI